MTLRITTWNVNGIRNPFGYQPWRDKRTFDGMFDILEADIVIMQELKIQRKDLRDDMVLVPGWDCYFSLPKHKKGYSGVGIYTRQSVCAPIHAEEGILGCIGGYPTDAQIASLGVDPAALDAEGRCVALEFPAFVLFGVYSPANSNGLRDDFRYAFLSALDMRIRNLDRMGKRVVLTGDLNVSRAEIDTANAEETMRKEGILHEDYISTPNRRIFNQLLEGGEVVGQRDEGREKPVLWDVCRGFHEGRKGMYTHWEQKINARPGNFGSRIDYILASIEMKSWFCESDIQEGLMGSDHCPVYAVIKERVDYEGKEVNIRDIMNPPGMFKDGERLVEHTMKILPAFSGRLLPEFDKRRSIRDMFAPKASPRPSRSTPNSLVSSAEDLGSSIQSSAPASSMLPTAEGGVPAANGTTPNGISPTVKTSRKRPADALSAKPAKRTKSTTISGAPAAFQGQKTLTGFFRPKSLPATPPPAADTPTADRGLDDTASGNALAGTAHPANEGAQPASPSQPLASAFSRQPSPTAAAAAAADSKTNTPPLSLRSPSSTNPQPQPQQDAVSNDVVIDPIVSKESWNKLFTKPSPPRCEGHGEPCLRMVTKKAGFNCGRAFWICARLVEHFLFCHGYGLQDWWGGGSSVLVGVVGWFSMSWAFSRMRFSSDMAHSAEVFW
ncbi:Class II abasic (AP) endonuclease [Coniosporium tulheliwenetii]|uniref:Class II abasic (AP) endonuclease n=1 Tax=Coniosporium tulheliwenetii TaxID=3383036 RepID=A0ACC2Z2Q7_9PEZI|nr:Class II abasic (AP) endonuclease [Cladosporium sp. JES 115]